jgi:hypothetical protein
VGEPGGATSYGSVYLLWIYDEWTVVRGDRDRDRQTERQTERQRQRERETG